MNDDLPDHPICPDPPGVVLGDTPAEILDLRGFDPMIHNLVGWGPLHQDREWITAEGERLRLEDMTPSHRRNLLRWLRRRARRLELADALLYSAGLFTARGDMAQLAEEEWLDWRTQNPEEWLESTKLVTRLRELVMAEYDDLFAESEAS